MSQTSEETAPYNEATGVIDEPATALRLARVAWGQYIDLESGMPDPATPFYRMHEALLAVADNFVGHEFEDALEASKDQVLAKSENLAFNLTAETSVTYHEACHVYASKHMRNLTHLLEVLGEAFGYEIRQGYLIDAYAARADLGRLLKQSAEMFTHDVAGEITEARMRQAYENLTKLTPRHGNAHHQTMCAAEHMRRLDALANARYHVYAALVAVQRAVFWLGEHLRNAR